MKIEIEIESGLAGFIGSLTIDELDGDKINEDIDSSEHYYQLINYGLVSCILNDEEEAEWFLTVPGKIVYEKVNGLLKKL